MTLPKCYVKPENTEDNSKKRGSIEKICFSLPIFYFSSETVVFGTNRIPGKYDFTAAENQMTLCAVFKN